jgi:hypothetical protein
MVELMGFILMFFVFFGYGGTIEQGQGQSDEEGGMQFLKMKLFWKLSAFVVCCYWWLFCLLLVEKVH